MPKRTDIGSILIIGAGPIVIGQAAEFDYSGSQAVKALKAEGYRVIVVNSNPATIMTDPELADATYVEPITPGFVASIIEKERPDAVLPTMGGQTALNTALALYQERDARAARGRADRRQCRGDREGRGPAEVPRGDGPDRARKPALGDRPQPGGGACGARESRAAGDHPPELHARRDRRRIAYNREEFEAIVAGGLEASPTTEVLIEESVLGWKEYEMEVVRDKADNAIIICSIENIDPMGVHTGDSITVAPALTLTDKEYQRMRSASDRGAARNRRRNRRFQRPVRSRSEDRADGRHRDEPARVAVLGAGVEGDRLPDRQGRGQAGGRLHARRDFQRHHRRRDPGELRADDRLCRHQDPALRVREVQGRARLCCRPR
jgi:carbamoyl-phosphate synthase large subunit